MFWKATPDPGPPHLLLVADGAFDGADDLHHFLVVHGGSVLGGERALSRRPALVSEAAGPPASEASGCLHGEAFIAAARES